MKSRRLFHVIVFSTLVTITLMNLYCYGPPPTSGSASADVPFVHQDGTLYCAAASVLAWRLHDGLPSVPQLDILTAMGGTPSSGTASGAIPIGVDRYTETSDAYLDFGQGGAYNDYQGQFLSRQVSSVVAGVPVIALTEGTLHTVVVDGGDWNTNAQGYRVWLDVRYMDPGYGFLSVTPGDLVNSMCPNDYDACNQIISQRASADGSTNFSDYGGSTEAVGIMYGPGGGPDQQHQ